MRTCEEYIKLQVFSKILYVIVSTVHCLFIKHFWKTSNPIPPLLKGVPIDSLWFLVAFSYYNPLAGFQQNLAFPLIHPSTLVFDGIFLLYSLSRFSTKPCFSFNQFHNKG